MWKRVDWCWAKPFSSWLGAQCSGAGSVGQIHQKIRLWLHSILLCYLLYSHSYLNIFFQFFIVKTEFKRIGGRHISKPLDESNLSRLDIHQHKTRISENCYIIHGHRFACLICRNIPCTRSGGGYQTAAEDRMIRISSCWRTERCFRVSRPSGTELESPSRRCRVPLHRIWGFPCSDCFPVSSLRMIQKVLHTPGPACRDSNQPYTCKLNDSGKHSEIKCAYDENQLFTRVATSPRPSQVQVCMSRVKSESESYWAGLESESSTTRRYRFGFSKFCWSFNDFFY